MVKQTPEGKVKDQLKDILDELGAYYIMPMGTEYGNNGVSDFVIALPNPNVPALFVAIETKATKKQKPTELQKQQLNAAAKTGALTMVCNADNIEEIGKVLRHAANANYGQLQTLAVWARERWFAPRKTTRTKAVPVSREEFIRRTRNS